MPTATPDSTPDAAADARQVAERALRRATGAAPAQALASDTAPLPDGSGVRSTTVWRLARATWRTVVDSVTVGGGTSHLLVEVVDAAAPGRGVRGWDERYRAEPGPAAPHRAVVEAVTGKEPGTALDIGCGTGRHSLWLAENGWRVTALDFSRVGIDALARAAAGRGLELETQVGDARAWAPPGESSYDLVLMTFVHLPEVLTAAARWVAPGGRLLVVGHSARTTGDDGAGPADPRLRLDRIGLAARVTGARLRVLRAAEVERETTDGTATDVVLLAVKP